MLALLVSFTGLTQALPADPDDRRLREISAEVRCLVCQNQNLLDSSAPLAQDLKNQIREMISANKSNEQILDYLTDRYGDFVLYDPPFKASTWVLWLAPFVLIAMMIGALRTRLSQTTEHEAMTTQPGGKST